MAHISTQKLVIAAVRVARPVHWVKNLSLFAALIFSGTLYDKSAFINVFWAFLAFNAVASAVYILNDIFDAPRDRLHPIKKNRPIAAGHLPVSLALIEMAVLLLFSLTLSIRLSELLFFLIGAYFLLQIAYSFVLKNLPVIDIIVIATGFVIRVYAGAFAIDAHLSVWFLLCVISAALFLASGKRRAELSIVGSGSRKSLEKYPRELLNSYITMFANAAWMSWALFTFYEPIRASTPVWLILSDLSRATAINKLLMITIPVSIFAIMRYEYLIFQGRSEAPEKVLLTDKALVASVIIWTTLVVWILYGGLAV